MHKQILAEYDATGIYVYQAYNPSIASAALRDGKFGEGGFQFGRMTWIKPSWGWMLHRSGYGRKPNQAVILKIKLSHAHFIEILSQGVLSKWYPELHPTEDAWRAALAQSQVRIQWDPDRNWRDGKLERRAIQIGLRGAVARAYATEWILSIEDVTALAHQHEADVRQRLAEPSVPLPPERVYAVDEIIRRRWALGG
jgi:hypothetical protein